jgi:hypothetical protein
MRVKDYFAKTITWNKSKDAQFPYKAVFEGEPITIRLNDFPAANLYTLIADGSEISFDDWPSLWAKSRAKAAKKAVTFEAVPRERLVKA